MATAAQAYQVTPPEPFSFSSPSEWPKWKRRFERCRVAAGLSKKSEEEQVNALIYFMGDTADDILLSFGLSDTESKKYDTVLTRFEDHFILKRNVIFERARFNSRVQEEGEAVDDFITALYTLVQHCDYSTLQDQLIRDRIVVGVKDRQLAEKMQLDEKLTLEKAIKMSRQNEAVKNQMKIFRHEVSDPNLDRVSSTSTGGSSSKCTTVNHKTVSFKDRPSSPKEMKTCKFCGRSHEMKKEKCPAWGKNCNTCGEQNHFSKMCKAAPEKVNKVTSGLNNSDQDIFLLNSISAVTDKERQSRWTARVHVNKVDISFKLDPGADVTVIPLSTFKRSWTYKSLTIHGRRLCGPDGSKLQVVGSFDAILSHDDVQIKETVFVVRGLERPLLGLRACEDLKLVRRLDSIEIDTLTKVKPKDEFPELFKGLGNINPPHSIKLKEGAKPYAIHSPRRVPLPLMDKVKYILDKLVKDEVIEPVDEPTEWCAPMVLAPKPNGDKRICADLTRLNLSVEREYHPMPVVEHTLGQLAGAVVFSKLDANSGFHQIAITPESKKLTTFIAPFGRYCYRRLPFGISSAPEVFQKRMNEILKEQTCVVHLDDILVWGATVEEHDRRLRGILHRLQEAHVTLNDEKCEFGVASIKFLGHIINKDGIRPDPSKIEAVVNFPKPQNVSDLRRLLGMTNYLGRFVPNLSNICKPLNEMLKPDRQFCWDASQEEAFRLIKKTLTEKPVLALFDVNKKTILSADSSSFGLGAVLLQVQEDKQVRPVSFASRTLTPAEQRYVQIEKEALASTWACERFRDFVTGAHITIETDHQPLLSIFMSKNLDDLSPRLQRFRLRLMRFSYQMKYVAGKKLLVADTLSRQPLPHSGDVELENEVAAYVNHIVSNIPIGDEYLAKIWEAQILDPTLSKIISYCTEGWPDKNKLDPECAKFWNSKDSLSCTDGLLLFCERAVIPKSLQEEVLGKIHEGHMGIVKCRARARDTVWWPGVSGDIAEVVRRCPACVKERVERHEPLIPTKFPTRPWQKVAMDLMKLNGKWFLVIIDYYSRYPEVAQLNSLTSESVIHFCKSVFSRHGVPEEVMSDNGPQFSPLQTSLFRQFAQDYGFRSVTSSPHYPQSNGMAEAGVKIVKQLLKKNSDWFKALLEYRATPLFNGFSPAELLMGRRIRSCLPMNPIRLLPQEINQQSLQQTKEKHRNRQKKNFDRRHGVSDEKTVADSDVVWVKDLRTWGVLCGKADYPRSFYVNTPRGKFRRNTFHLIKAHTNEIPDLRLPEIPLNEDDQIDPEPTANFPQSPSPDTSNFNYQTRYGRIVRPPRRLIAEI